MSELISRANRFGPDRLPDSAVVAKERLDLLAVEIASIEGNIARLDNMMDVADDDEFAALNQQRVHAQTARRHCCVEQAWLKAWLRKNDHDDSTRLLRGILMQLVTLTSAVSRLGK